jgi:hypothetical protein
MFGPAISNVTCQLLSFVERQTSGKALRLTFYRLAIIHKFTKARDASAGFVPIFSLLGIGPRLAPVK